MFLLRLAAVEKVNSCCSVLPSVGDAVRCSWSMLSQKCLTINILFVWALTKIFFYQTIFRTQLSIQHSADNHPEIFQRWLTLEKRWWSSKFSWTKLIIWQMNDSTSTNITFESLHISNSNVNNNPVDFVHWWQCSIHSIIMRTVLSFLWFYSANPLSDKSKNIPNND